MMILDSGLLFCATLYTVSKKTGIIFVLL